MDRIILLLLIMAAMLTVPVSNAESGLTVHPSRQELRLTTGTLYSDVYFVKNEYDERIKVEISTRDWIVLPENKEHPMTQWLTLAPTSFYLNSKEEKQVTYTLNVPEKLTGESAAVISFAPRKDGPINLLLSVALYVFAKGTEKVEWQIEKVTFHNRYQQLEARIVVKNTGNIHARPEGSIKIRKGDAVVDEINITESRPVYPGTTKTYQGSRQGKPLSPGDYNAFIFLKDEFSGSTSEGNVSLKVLENGTIEVR